MYVQTERQRLDEATAQENPLEGFFSLRTPKDLKAGVASGLKSMGKGILAGTVGLVAAPAIGVHEEGLKGFAKGMAGGVLGAVVLPVAGTGIGLAQVARGAWNTPEAIYETSRGRFWDQPGLALMPDDELFAAARKRWRAKSGAGAGPSGRGEDLYELLGVARDATPEQIKRQYYLQARRMHPDKNPDDPGAKERFQKLGEAYQVLGNEELRARYDAHGDEALDVNFMDGAEFFTMLFGSDKFEHLVGELMLAAAARNPNDFGITQLRKLQVAREEQLVTMLKALLRRWVEGDCTGFRESMEGEGRMLADTSFGAKILLTLGRIYSMQADILLGGVLHGTVAAVRHRAHTVSLHFAAAGMAIKMYQAHQEMEKFDRETERRQLEAAEALRLQQMQVPNGTASAPAAGPSQVPGKAEAETESAKIRAEMEEAALPIMLEAMWAANVLDIEATARHVCKKVLGDPYVGKGVRRARAEGLRELGAIFQAAANAVLDAQADQAKDVEAAKRQVEDAMMAVLQKHNTYEDAVF